MINLDNGSEIWPKKRYLPSTYKKAKITAGNFLHRLGLLLG